MKNQAEAIFDAFAEMVGELGKADAIKKQEVKIANCTRKKCGNCDHWMKSTCKPEKERGQRKSMNSYACSDFVLAYSSKLIIGSAKEKLAILKQPEGT